MNYRLILLVILTILLVGCQSEPIVEPFELIGDIESWAVIDDTSTPINPVEMIENYNPLYSDYDIIVSSADGFSVRITGDSLEGTQLEYAKDTGWMFVSDHHPVNSGVKWISEIIVVKKKSEEENFSSGLNIIKDNEDHHFSLGELLSSNYSVRFHLDGTTEQAGNSIDVMKKVKYFPLENLLSLDYKWLLVMDGEGNHHYLQAGDYNIELRNQRIDLLGDDLIIKDLKGIMMDPPDTAVMDNYYDALNYIKKDIPVMTIFIDGFSYNQWEYVKTNKSNLYLSSLGFRQAHTVFKPVTNAGFAAMISGKTPAETGIMDRSVRKPECTTLFDEVEEGILVDGLVKILDVPCKLYLENDHDEDGYTDFETYDRAKDVLGGDYILVHFNGVDEAGHDYGPFGDETIGKIVEVDDYVKDLVDKWHGKVIIVADHGMHKTKDAGDHGEFRVDDLMIPYILMDGGKYEQAK